MKSFSTFKSFIHIYTGHHNSTPPSFLTYLRIPTQVHCSRSPSHQWHFHYSPFKSPQPILHKVLQERSRSGLLIPCSLPFISMFSSSSPTHPITAIVSSNTLALFLLYLFLFLYIHLLIHPILFQHPKHSFFYSSCSYSSSSILFYPLLLHNKHSSFYSYCSYFSSSFSSILSILSHSNILNTHSSIPSAPILPHPLLFCISSRSNILSTYSSIPCAPIPLLLFYPIFILFHFNILNTHSSFPSAPILPSLSLFLLYSLLPLPFVIPATSHPRG